MNANERRGRADRKQQSMIPRTVPVGAGSLVFSMLDFLNGYQAGHLAYMADGRPVLFTDETLRILVMDRLESLDHTERYCVGYVVGWIVSLATKGGPSHDS